MKRRFLSRVLVFALVLALLPAGAFADAEPLYSDTQTHWAREAVDKWSGLGILRGADGLFRPDDSITRGETAVILDRVMKYQVKAQNNFTDLGQDFYTDAMLRANAAGIMRGDAGAIRPADKITREEAIVVLGRAFGLAENAAGAAAFDDAASVSAWAKGYVGAMAARGYIQGDGGLFNPKSPITRAEVVTILNNAVSGLYTEAATYSENLSGTVIVNVPGAVLKDMTVTGDLILTEGVGQGDVTLDHVKVTGNTIVRGGGANSIHIIGGSELGAIIIEKRDDGSVRIVTEDGSVVEAIYVDDGSDDIILTGSFKSVTVAADVNIVVDTGSTVATLTVAAAGATVDNGGTITKAVVNADGVVLDGNKPGSVTVDDSVTEPPTGSGAETTPPPTGGGGGGGGDSTPSLSANVTKLATVNQSDGNTEASEENQGLVTVSQSGNTVTVRGDLKALGAFTSADPEQTGSHKWVGLKVATGLSSIVGVKYNGVALTEDDVAEAASVGVPAGSFVLWIKADEVVTTPKAFELTKTGYRSKSITVNFVDTGALTGTVTKLATVNPNDDNATVSQANQNAVSVAKNGDTYTVSGDLGALNAFESMTPAQGEHMWVGLVVATGQSSIVGVNYNGSPLTEDDAAEAATVGVPAGSFVLWLKVDELVATGKTFTLSQTGRADKVVTVNFADTNPLTGTVTKIVDVFDDDNEEESQDNQDDISVTKDGDTYTVTGDIGGLNSFTSATPAQGEHMWLGFVVETGQESIIGVKYNGYDLAQFDVDEAATVGAGAGKFVLWLKADELVEEGMSFTLSQVGRLDKEITVEFVDDNPLTCVASGDLVILDNNDLAENQGLVEVSQTGDTVTVTGDLAALNTTVSATPAQGSAKWVGIAFFTGQPDITKLKYNDAALTEADVAEAESVGLDEPGYFVLWIKAEVVAETPKTFTLSQTGRLDKELTVTFVDTPAPSTQVAAVTGIEYAVEDDGVYLTFTLPADTTGIMEYEIEFSTDDGANWGNCYVVSDSDDNVPIGDLALKVSDTTEFNSVRVTSCADTGYTDNEAVADIDFTITVAGTELVFTVDTVAENSYTLNLPQAAEAGELYAIQVTKESDAPDYYPLGFVFPYASVGGDEIALMGNPSYPIVNGSLFAVIRITSVTPTGFTVTPAQAVPVEAS